jgi:TRAP-type C4-dicarboxylate transport system permease large subunit
MTGVQRALSDCVQDCQLLKAESARSEIESRSRSGLLWIMRFLLRGCIALTAVGAIALSAHLRLRMRDAVMGEFSCSAISAAASNASLIASNTRDAHFDYKLVNAYLVRSSSASVIAPPRL